jgi:hypothetical protein
LAAVDEIKEKKRMGDNYSVMSFESAHHDTPL